LVLTTVFMAWRRKAVPSLSPETFMTAWRIVEVRQRGPVP
jgi:hypothetical protein